MTAWQRAPKELIGKRRGGYQALKPTEYVPGSLSDICTNTFFLFFFFQDNFVGHFCLGWEEGGSIWYEGSGGLHDVGERGFYSFFVSLIISVQNERSNELSKLRSGAMWKGKQIRALVLFVPPGVVDVEKCCLERGARVCVGVPPFCGIPDIPYIAVPYIS